MGRVLKLYMIRPVFNLLECSRFWRKSKNKVPQAVFPLGTSRWSDQEKEADSESEMLHELLLALLGYTGDFVIDERERAETLGLADPSQIPDEPTFKLAPDLSFIQPSERSVVPLFSPPNGSLYPFPSRLDNVSCGFLGFCERWGLYIGGFVVFLFTF